MLSQTFPPKPTFTIEDIPDLTGKIVIVTGANTGVGKETAKALLLRNAKVYVAARSQEKAEQAITELKEQTGKEAVFLKLDLGDLPSIRKSAEEFQSKEEELHILFNNAGVMRPPIDSLTAQKYDLQFGTNVLGHFYFTKLLLPTLLATAKSCPDRNVRVVTTSSSGHELSSGINFDTLKDTPKRKKKNPMDLYSQSKLGNVLIANEFARRYGEQGLVSTACNPGNLKSDLQRNLNGIENVVVKPLLFPTAHGALTQLYAGTSLEGATLNGEYLIPWARVGKASKTGRDLELAAKLWEWCEEQVASV
ncbi:NAD-binding protein [Cyathus striatus]|nr:NAD-binding protein [Cyathus striatus]